MPKRSNDFQAITYLVKKTVADDAVVVESAMLTDRHTGDDREVDVTVRAEVGGHEVLVGIECVDHARRASVEWVERMVGKHESLPTNLLVLASRSGFSPAASRKAEAEGVVTITLDESPEAVEARLRTRLEHLRMLSFSLAVQSVALQVEEGAGGALMLVPGAPPNDVYLPDGTRIASLHEIAAGYLSVSEIPKLVYAQASKPIAEYSAATIEFSPSVTIDGVDHLLYVRRVSDGEMRRIVRVQVTATFKGADEAVEFAHGRLGDHRVSWATTKLADGPCLLVATQNAQGEVVLSAKDGSREATSIVLEDSDCAE